MSPVPARESPRHEVLWEVRRPVAVLNAIEVEPDDPRAPGATVRLAKPFNSADLLAAIRSRLRPRNGVGP